MQVFEKIIEKLEEKKLEHSVNGMQHEDSEVFLLEREEYGKFQGLKEAIEIVKQEAARIWIKVKDVRVERLQDITEEQVYAEGFRFKPPCLSMVSADGHYCDLDGPCTSSIKYCDMSMGELFGKELWNSTIKKSDLDRYGWDANPYVWAISFERCEKPEESPYAWNDAIHKLTKGV